MERGIKTYHPQLQLLWLNIPDWSWTQARSRTTSGYPPSFFPPQPQMQMQTDYAAEAARVEQEMQAFKGLLPSNRMEDEDLGADLDTMGDWFFTTTGADAPGAQHR